jgi:hypothetical protein
MAEKITVAKTVDKVAKFSFKTLPEVREVAELKSRKRIIALLTKLAELDLEMKANKTRMDKTKDELETLQNETGMIGFRFEKLCFISREVPGKKTLDKMALIENGVEPEVIEKSMKTGKSYIEHRFKDISDGEDE